MLYNTRKFVLDLGRVGQDRKVFPWQSYYLLDTATRAVTGEQQNHFLNQHNFKETNFVRQTVSFGEPGNLKDFLGCFKLHQRRSAIAGWLQGIYLLQSKGV